ncbi:MAG: trigger factor [Acidobacteriota bacterium]|nr:trigger factor [Acidobacteriota bacterium]
MKVQVEDLSQVRKRLAIEVPAEEVQSAWDRALRQARREMKFPGFRPGKAPLALVRAQVGKTLGGKVAEALVGRYASEAIREQGLRPIDGGIFLDLARDQEDPPPAEEGESYTFGVLVELPPDFEVEDYAGVKVARPKVEVDTEDVQKELNALRESFATYEPVEGRPSADGDELVLQIEGHEKDGELRLERRASQLRLGDEGNLPEFNEHLASLEVGDSFSFEVQYPDEKRYGDLAGRLMVFSGEIEEIRQRVVPEMDDAWAAGFSDIENLAQLRERMREAIEARRNSEADAVARERLLDRLLDRTPFEVPPSLVEAELEYRLNAIGRDLARRGIDPKNADLNWEEVVDSERKAAERSVRRDFLLDAIAAREQIEVEAAEVDRAIEQIARENGVQPEEVRRRLAKGEGLKSLKQQVLRSKCLDWLYARAHIV